jgi:hypothetical protein
MVTDHQGVRDQGGVSRESGLGRQEQRCRLRLSTVRSYFNCRHPTALPRTVGWGQAANPRVGHDHVSCRVWVKSAGLGVGQLSWHLPVIPSNKFDLVINVKPLRRFASPDRAPLFARRRRDDRITVPVLRCMSRLWSLPGSDNCRQKGPVIGVERKSFASRLPSLTRRRHSNRRY